jgi:ubiquinone/menaquinone biosynthesis C-methylase UbiE
MVEIASNREWKKWGELDPLYGVASWPGKNKGSADPWTNEDFYRLGQSDWQDFRNHWQKYGLSLESCLEIGCGAGRITKQLAKDFSRVYAIDISKEMIAYAQQEIQSSSVVFQVCSGADIPLEDKSVSSVFSTHVFQHFDPLSLTDAYFAEIARVMKPGGTLMIHLPIYAWPAMPKVFDKLYQVRELFSDIKARMGRLMMTYGISRPIMRGHRYPIEYFYQQLPKYGFGDIELGVFVTKINNDPHSFVFARKKS